jgi:hypothetical protein
MEEVEICTDHVQLRVIAHVIRDDTVIKAAIVVTHYLSFPVEVLALLIAVHKAYGLCSNNGYQWKTSTKQHVPGLVEVFHSFLFFFRRLLARFGIPLPKDQIPSSPCLHWRRHALS